MGVTDVELLYPQVQLQDLGVGLAVAGGVMSTILHMPPMVVQQTPLVKATMVVLVLVQRLAAPLVAVGAALAE
jgi:hypothetical protein